MSADARSTYVGDELTSFKTQMPLKDINCEHSLSRFMQLAERAHAHLHNDDASVAFPQEAKFFCMFIQTNLIHPVCSLIAEFAGITCSSGTNQISGEGETSHPAVGTIAYVLHRSIFSASAFWFFPSPTPYHPTVSREHLLGFMIWDGWLRTPTQVAHRQLVATGSPLFLRSFGEGEQALAANWRYGN